jgi:Phosphoenolpyruvate-dependent sugar phosphotransferase system, EIIA 2
MLGLTPRYVESTRPESPRRMLALSRCFEPSHILSDRSGKTKTGVIGELAAHAQKLGLVRDDSWFVGALIQRENVMPSAIGNGLARWLRSQTSSDRYSPAPTGRASGMCSLALRGSSSRRWPSGA